MINTHKKGQVAIWVIISIAIVAIFALILILRPVITGNQQSEINPQPVISSCISDGVNEAVSLMLPHGGFIYPNNSANYSGVEVAYTCENTGNYKPCINQHPRLFDEMESQISTYLNPVLEGCFSTIRSDAEKNGATVYIGPMQLNTSIEDGYVLVDVSRNVSITRNNQTSNYNIFSTRVKSPLYSLTRVAQEITNQEANYCYFEYVGYMLLYPEYKISVTRLPDSTKIYSITDSNTNKGMNIAIRGCVIPAGM